jgi:hypothetical protein
MSRSEMVVYRTRFARVEEGLVHCKVDNLYFFLLFFVFVFRLFGIKNPPYSLKSVKKIGM